MNFASMHLSAILASAPSARYIKAASTKTKTNHHHHHDHLFCIVELGRRTCVRTQAKTKKSDEKEKRQSKGSGIEKGQSY